MSRPRHLRVLGWWALLSGLTACLCARPARADSQDEARRHFNTAIELVRLGDPEGGVREFLLAYELAPHPVVIYNIGRAYAEAGNLVQALEYFQRYLATEPKDRAEVEGLVIALQRRIKDLERAPQPAAEPSSKSGSEAEIARLTERIDALSEELQRLRQQGGAAEPPGKAPVEGVTSQGERPGASASETLIAPDAPIFVSPSGDPYAREVVTASRYGQDPLQAPAAVSILTRERIEASAASNTADLLRSLPGLDVMLLTASQPEVGIRGFNGPLSNKVLVLVDGRSVYLDFIGATLWSALPLTIDDIERIEVIRGVGSAMYGANAFTGVVNIITRDPGSVRDHVMIEAGNQGYLRSSLALSGRARGTSWKASAGLETLGRSAKALNLEQHPELRSPAPDQDMATESRAGSFLLERAFSDRGLVSVSAGLREGTGEYTAIGSMGDFFVEQNSGFLRADAGWGPLRLRSSWSHFGGVTGPWYEPAVGPSLQGEVDSDGIEVELGGDFRLGSERKHRLGTAFSYRRKDISWSYLNGPHREDHWGGYLQEESRLGPFTLNGALRVDAHPLVGVTPSPRLAVVGKLAEGRALRWSAGTAFRAPTFMESYLALDQELETDALSIRSEGDTELEPERIISIEAAWLEQSSDRWRAECSLYLSQIDNLIYQGPISASDPGQAFDASTGGWRAGTTRFENDETAWRATGGEIEAEYFGVDSLDIWANYAFEYLFSLGDAVLEQDGSTPLHKVNLGLSWRSPFRTNLSTLAHWVDRTRWPLRDFDDQGEVRIVETPIPGYTVLESRVTLRPLTDGTLELSFSAWNWLATLPGLGAHREHPEGQPVDARFYGTVKYHFK